MPHLLIVDDILENIQLLGRLLKERLECTIAVAQDGEAALRSVAYERPDLILLDVMMPRMNGYEVCRALQQDPATADIPIIFLTAKVEEEDVVTGLGIGAVDYVTKPVRQEVLLARVRTQLKIEEKEKRILEESRQRANLLHILCHDIANPIAAVRGCVHLLSGDDPTAHQRELLRLANVALESANGLIEQVRRSLSLAEGKRRLDLRPWTVRELVEDSVAMLEARFAEKSVRLEVALEEDGPVFTERLSFTNSVLNNLLTNALKFSDPGGCVRLSSRADDAWVVLEVADEGLGMSEALLECVFDFTSSTSRPGTAGEEGTGYGMPLVKAFMDASGGSIAIDSRARSSATAGDGYTRVELRLPRA